MNKIAGNDLLEILYLAPGESSAPRVVQHHRDGLDGRARMFLDLVKAWGAISVLGDIMSGAICDAHDGGNPMSPAPVKAPKETIVAFVMRCAEVTESAYEEIERRGWLVKVPSMVDEAD